MSRVHHIENAQERLNWLRLIRTPKVGPITFWELMRLFGSATEAIAHAPSLAQRGGGGLRITKASDAEAEINRCQKFGAEILLACDKAYPRALSCLPDMPPVLTVKGRTSLLSSRQVAIVGARNASLHGVNIALRFAQELGKAGLVITSGLAKGIDVAAHRGAIDTGTVAVIAGGIDHIYPREHESWYRRIGSEGVIISELPIGSAPLTQHFPQRNRIIAGLALAVVVVEAAQKSGTLITARHALEYGKEVLAVPGSPLDPRTQGTNALIRQGATLVTSSDDILEAIAVAYNPQLQEPKAQSYHKPPLQIPTDKELMQHRRTLLYHLSPTPCHFATIVEHSNIPVNTLSLLIIEMELAGKVYRTSDNQIGLNVMTPVLD